MRRHLPSLLLLSLVAACGGKVASSSGSLGGEDVPAPSPTGGVVVSPPPPAPAPAPSGPLPPKPENATYSAYAWPGGLDHIEIFKADFARDICVHVHLSSPGSAPQDGPFAAFTTPEGWSIQSADRSKGASACKPEVQREATQAADGKGLIQWPSTMGQLFPCKLDVHGAIIFEGSKAAEQLDADAVPVNGC